MFKLTWMHMKYGPGTMTTRDLQAVTEIYLALKKDKSNYRFEMTVDNRWFELPDRIKQ